MSLSLTQIIAPSAVPTSVSPLFTASHLTRVDKMTVTNPTGGALNVTIYMVSAGVTLSNTSIVTPTTSVGASAALNVKEMIGQVLQSGDSIQVIGSGAGLTTMASGVVQT